MSLSSYLQSVRSKAEKATPGDWIVDVSPDYAGRYEIRQAIGTEHKANAELIAHGRTDIETLLALVETQRKTLEKIAGRDYRGNRPQDSVDAFQALAECERIVGEK